MPIPAIVSALLPSALGIIGSLFKGNKTKYTNQQTPQQAAAMNQLLKMIQQRMGGQSAGYQPTMNAMNNVSQMFYGQPANQGQGMGSPQPFTGMPTTSLLSRYQNAGNQRV